MASEQQFCLRWNNHQSTLVAVFDTLLESGTLVDCTLAAEGQYLKAHKVVLSACSPYFELLLSQHNEKHPIVILKDVKFQELKAMMDYMYRGEVNISQDQLGALLKAAESLQIKGLSDSGGGNEREPSDRRHSRKEVAPQPPQARSPPLPHSSGLTIEHRRSAQQAAPPVVELPEDSPPGTGPHIGGSREGSVSPIPRKRKRHRRRSSTGEEGAQGLLPMTDSHDQTSSSCELPPQSQPAPATNIPAIISPVVPTPSAISRAASDPLSIGPEEQTEPELKRSSLPPSQPNISSAEVLPPDPEPVQKLEPPSEILLEPKSEYLDDTMNEDSVENLTTLDDVDDMDEARPGPSHGGEGSSNQGSGFAPWHVRATERTTDEVFMAAQEAVGAHRDSQGLPLQQRSARFQCPRCFKTYGARRSLWRHAKFECGKDPMFQCHLCFRKFTRKQTLTVHMQMQHSPSPRRAPTDRRSEICTVRAFKQCNKKCLVVVDCVSCRPSPIPRCPLPLLRLVLTPNSVAGDSPGGGRLWGDEGGGLGAAWGFDRHAPGAFPCTAGCGRVYRQQKNMLRHVRHDCGREPRFGCPICAHRTRRRNNLLAHMARRHGVGPDPSLASPPGHAPAAVSVPTTSSLSFAPDPSLALGMGLELGPDDALGPGLGPDVAPEPAPARH